MPVAMVARTPTQSLRAMEALAAVGGMKGLAAQDGRKRAAARGPLPALVR
jgi:hypothetical protein